MQLYRLTDAELAELVEVSKPVPYMVIGAVPQSSYDRAMEFWARVAARVGCDVHSIEPAEMGDDHLFRARPKG